MIKVTWDHGFKKVYKKKIKGNKGLMVESKEQRAKSKEQRA